MKKLLLFIALLLACTFVNAQDFPATKPELLLGKTVAVKPIHERNLAYQGGGYRAFFDDEALNLVYKIKSQRTPPEVMANRKFTVISIKPVAGRAYQSHSIKLEDKASREIIYYGYSDDSPGQYWLEVEGGLELPLDLYCSELQESTDSKGWKILQGGDLFKFIMYRRKKGSSVDYGLMLELGKDAFTTGTGVTIYLDNGAVISRPDEQVDIDRTRKTPHFTAGIFLTPDEIELLKKHLVTGFKLYNYEEKLYLDQGPKLRSLLHCLLAAK